MVAEREDKARNVHQQMSGKECKNNREKDTRHDSQRITRVDVLTKRSIAMSAPYIVERQCHSRAKQAEDQRYGGRGGQTERVVDIKQDDIREHHTKEENHNLLVGKHRRIEDTATCYVHHTA